METKMTFSATGDSFITRCCPQEDAEFQKVKEVLKSAEARFTNLETTVHDMEAFPSAQSGGTWAVAPPKVLETLRNYGFNLIGTANNHSMDYSYGGLEATGRYLKNYGFTYAGTGKHLAEAGAPAFLDCLSGRVALIAATSSLFDSWVAGEQRRDMVGRPGVNPLRVSTEYLLEPEEFEVLKRIASKTGINAYDDMIRKEGFLPKLQEDEFMLGQYVFKKSHVSGVITKPDKKDMERLEKTVRQAVNQADYVLVSIHSHQIKGTDKNEPTDFLVTASRRCIDAGAHAVIGHGPHVLRGIEIYKGKPVFYSLGNFIFQSETVSALPSDFYEKYGLGHDHDTVDALLKRSGNGTKGLSTDKNALESVIARWTMEDGGLKEIKLFPIELGYGLPPYRLGRPKISDRMDILERLQALSKPFGTEIHIHDGIGTVRL